MKRGILILLFLGLGACNYSKVKGGGDDVLGKTDVCGVLDFPRMQAEIFSNCTGCHSTENPNDGISVSKYSEVIGSLGQIEDAIRNNRMPKGKPFDAGKKALLRAWMDVGAPEAADKSVPVVACGGEPVDPVDPPPVDPDLVQANFEHLNSTVLASACNFCHDGTNKYDFSSYEKFIQSVELFNLTSPEDSRFIKSLRSGSMPMIGDALAPELIDIFAKWMKLGLPRREGDPAGVVVCGETVPQGQVCSIE